jgi:hypothetical protein
VDVVVVDVEANSEQTNMFAETSDASRGLEAVKLSEDLEQMLMRTAAVRWR